MKFLVQVGLVAVTLFSVSAALSVWLYQSRQPQTEATGANKDKEDQTPPEKEPTEGKVAKSPDAVTPARDEPGALASLRGREDRLERRAAQLELVVGDLKSEREAVDALMRKAAEELKAAATRVAETTASPKAPADVERAKAEADAAEKKHIDTMVRLYEAMAPEVAAPILRQMTDGGKMDTVARVLGQMKERQAARILGEFGDTSLAAQLLGRMRQFNPTPGGGPTPAGAPANLPPTRPTP
mgnify:CR=1 FL=1